jgi:putative transcriptional regulator
MSFKSGQGGEALPPDSQLPQHHINDDMLLAYAAGTLDRAASLLAATHLSLCLFCRTNLIAMEAVGGALLEDIAPEPISEATVGEVLSRLDAQGAGQRAASPKVDAKSLAGTLLPRCLLSYLPKDLNDLQWNRLSPGIKYSEMLKDANGTRVGLIRAAAGASVVEHGHSGEEFTVVLSGGYRDGAAQFRRGDIQSVDESVIHKPVTDTGGECLSLVMISGPIKPTPLIARIFHFFTGF